MEGVALLGAGGHAKVVIGVLEALGRPISGIYDDDPTKQGKRILDVPIVGTLRSFKAQGSPAVAAIGDNAARKRIAEANPAAWVTLVHPHAWVHKSVDLGPGTVVMAGAVVQPDARIGAHCIVNTNAGVDHDCVLGDYAHVAPGAALSGTTTLGEGGFLGTGSSTRQGVRIGAWAIVGAGACVVADLPDHVTAVGVPAKVIKGHPASRSKSPQ